MSVKFRIRAAWMAISLGAGLMFAPPSFGAGAEPAVLAASAAEAPAPSSEEASASAGDGVRRAERQIRRCANSERREAGLPRLEPAPALDRAARFHARNMAQQGFFDHTDPQGRGPGERVAKFDPKGRYTWIGENIAAGYSDPEAACEGWMQSSGHRANILSRNYTKIGGGYAVGGDWGRYYVQVFAAGG